MLYRNCSVTVGLDPPRLYPSNQIYQRRTLVITLYSTGHLPVDIPRDVGRVLL